MTARRYTAISHLISVGVAYSWKPVGKIAHRLLVVGVTTGGGKTGKRDWEVTAKGALWAFELFGLEWL